MNANTFPSDGKPVWYQIDPNTDPHFPEWLQRARARAGSLHQTESLDGGYEFWEFWAVSQDVVHLGAHEIIAAGFPCAYFSPVWSEDRGILVVKKSEGPRRKPNTPPPFPSPETVAEPSQEDLETSRTLLWNAAASSGGKRFTFKVKHFLPGTAEILLAELKQTGWDHQRESDQREGDFYFIFPIDRTAS